ncbi:DUF1102 domain-containing protein [Haloarchaeobius iranensis]|uniref:DUF1102 domain-containing protein n=1 Tax=Haloarchaeobius iranensis TaxID=996166 RepID=A0A1G9XYH8_9EURY|nr:DUF1102 domain-containing protein [Haloarchaeobius iranensis]SDN01556.1 Protein of unknown function [Haloarchaeobius iranensis]
MERRKFIAGVGSLAAGGAAALGTGAFTSVSATRNIDVEVADDASAYLRLEGTGGANSEYVTDDGNGGTLAINLDSNNATGAGGDGVNPDAVTQIDDLFVIENQGTQEVDVSLSKSGDNSGLVKFYTDSNAYDDGTSIGSGNNPVTLSTGSSVTVSIEIDTEGESVGDGDELLDSVTFNADATS